VLPAASTAGGGVPVLPVEPVTAPEVALMVVVPAATAVARPWVPLVLLMVAVPVTDEAHVTDVVRFWVLPSLNVPVAVNCWVAPTPIEGLAGVTAIDCSAGGGVTGSTVEPAVAPELALHVDGPLMVVVPAATVFRRPWVPLVLLMVAVPVTDEAHVTEVVRFWVLPSLKVPVAVNCWVPPIPIEGFAGVTAIDCKVPPPPP